MCHESSGLGAQRDHRHRQGHGDAGRPREGRPDPRRRARTRAPTTRGCSRRWRRPSAAGAKIVAVNPLPEAGLLRFKNPQNAAGCSAAGTPLADRFLQIRVGGDLALFRALGRLLLEAEDAAPGTVLDHAFIDEHTHGFEEYAEALRQRSTGTRSWPRPA